MASPARHRSLIVPREHGAWGILLVPLFTGAAIGLLEGGDAAPLVPLVIAALALFWLRTPVESWAGTTPVRARTPGEFRLVKTASAVLALVSFAALYWLFRGGRDRDLLWIGAAAAAAFLLQALVKRSRRNARTAAQMTGAVGLTATAPAAWYVVTGRFDAAAWTLWGANLLFAVNQIHFVQVRIRAAQARTRAEKVTAGRAFLAGQAVSVVMLIAACALRLIGWPATLAFGPVLYRGFAWFVAEPRALAIHSLGKSELGYACGFGLLLVLGTVILH